MALLSRHYTCNAYNETTRMNELTTVAEPIELSCCANSLGAADLYNQWDGHEIEYGL